MPRTARHKSKEAAFYRLTNRVAGRPDWFPLENPRARRKFLDMMLFYVNAYRRRSAAFQIMGNHSIPPRQSRGDKTVPTPTFNFA